MKIAVFIKSTTFHKGYGGLQTQNKSLCEGLVKKGHQVHVYSPLLELATPEKEENGVKYFFVKSSYKMLFSKADKNSWENKSYEKFREMHKLEKYDVAVSQSSAGIGIIKNKNKVPIRVLGIAHGTIGGEMKTLALNIKTPKQLAHSVPSFGYGIINFFTRQRNYARGCDKIVAVSNAVKKSLVEETFIPESKVTVINNGIDPSKILESLKSASREPSDKVELLFLGRIEKAKGIIEALKACKENPKVRLNVVGDGPDLETAKSLARELKISNRVMFFGKLPYEKALEMYACSDIFILPSVRVEGFPMVLAEAMFAGLPIIASDIGGNSDGVENGVNGLLVEPGNIKDLAHKIKILSEDKKLREEMGRNGKIKAENNFSIEKMLSKYEICLNSIRK